MQSNMRECIDLVPDLNGQALINNLSLDGLHLYSLYNLMFIAYLYSTMHLIITPLLDYIFFILSNKLLLDFIAILLFFIKLG